MDKRVPFSTLDTKNLRELKPFLDDIVLKVEVPSYIDTDPVAFMHAYSDKKDREIAGFFAALMAWGRRDIVMKKVEDLMTRLHHEPFEVICRYKPSDSTRFDGFVHRTWNGSDVDVLCRILSRIYRDFGDFEGFWRDVYTDSQLQGVNVMELFHQKFFALDAESPPRTRRHVGDARKGSSCKRLWLFLRWCLRKGSVVDTGIMDFMPVSELMIPLDVHVARYARLLGLLGRPSNDWKAVVELTERLRMVDPTDPGKYDYALFGLGVLHIDVPDHLIVNHAFAP
jgi:uncharacterized protein (TIGR02757 family)